MSAPASIYTIDSLISDCVGRKISDPKGNVRVQALISGKTLAEIWGAVVQWSNKHVANRTAFSLKPLGIVVPEAQQNYKKVDRKAESQGE